MGGVSKYSDNVKLDMVDLIEQSDRFYTQNFPEAVLPYPLQIQVVDLINTMTEAQLLEMNRKILRAMEGRILGEHIAKANAIYKRKKLDEIRQHLGRL